VDVRVVKETVLRSVGASRVGSNPTPRKLSHKPFLYVYVITSYMSCSKCSVHPGFHNFTELGQTNAGANIWFSSPSLTEEKRFTEESIPNYIAHMDEAAFAGQWVWIFDAGGLDRLESPNPLVLRKFYMTVRERYKNTLQRIYILNMNWKVTMLYNMLYTFLCAESKRRLVHCETKMVLLCDGIPADIVQKVFS
jgi:hypothetical protein